MSVNSIKLDQLKFFKKIYFLIGEWEFKIIKSVYNFLFTLSRFLPLSTSTTKLTQHAVAKNFEHYLSLDYTKQIKDILTDKLVYLAIGARGDEGDDFIIKYRDVFNLILCEPEKKEAERLKKLGFNIIDKPLCKKPGEITFYHCRDATKSSIYKPGLFYDFYNRDPAYLKKWDIVSEDVMEGSTISDSLKDANIKKLDLIKMDVQGAELDILQGLGDYRPLIMMVEVEYLPMYVGIPNGFKLIDELFKIGYIPLQLGNNFNASSSPSVADVLFMPNWEDENGRKMILSREREYISLMVMFGQIDTLNFVAKKIKMTHSDLVGQIYKKYSNSLFH